MNKHALKCWVFLACIGLPANSSAYGPVGHMTVGTIADRLIEGTNAGKQVKKILGTNLRTASVWADCAKGVTKVALKYSGDGHYPECAVYENDASKAQMEAFVKRNLNNCKPAPGAEECHKQYHYTDVAIQQDKYSKSVVGTSDHDIVSAVSAAIAVLKGESSPVPFKISSKREALRILAHYVGDIHQPLHVAAVYLDANGKVVDPDSGTFDKATETRGGNDILHGSKKLHAEWDSVPASVNADKLLPGALNEAKAVPLTAGPMSEWSTVWATETLLEGKAAFNGLTYSKEDSAHHYKVTLQAGYTTLRSDIQRKQVIKAGARLAQILTSIWP